MIPNTKFVFITGGVMSGIGKGIVTASLGKLFQFRGFKISGVKIDPYLNVDPGTLNPIEHGECFITEQVWDFKPTEDDDYVYRISEIDMDFGSYERFWGIDIPPSHNITSGQIYLSTILRERKGKFLGRTVQIIPHSTNIIKDRLKSIAIEEDLDVLLVECGGTVGDIESQIFLESFRQLRLELPKRSTALVHVTLIPYSSVINQHKTKPTQHSVKILQAAGLQPDAIIGRSSTPLNNEIKEKISLFTNVPINAVISDPDLDVVYELPILFEDQKLGDYLCELLDLKAKLVTYSTVNNYSEWQKTVNLYKNAKETVTIGMPGKYFNISDSYISINSALEQAAAHEGYIVNLKMINITEDTDIEKELEGCDGILLTPGFGERAVEGMIKTAEYAMENKVPYLGICFGAQLLFVAFCRKYLGLKGANSTEIDPNTPHPVIDLLESQKEIKSKGGTMRLGGIKIKIEKGTRLYDAYKTDEIIERFRHRYHIIEKYIDNEAKQKGLVVSSRDETGKIINSIELNRDDHWMVGTQFHPEFKSKPYQPSPIYSAFIKSTINYKNGK